MNLMLPDSGLLFWMTIIFAIVFFVLAKFGFPVITGMVEKRTKRIDDAIGAAREAESKLMGLASQQEKMIEEARAEHDRILKEAAAERDRLIAAAQEQARDEAGKIMEETRERIRQEKEAALRDIRREVAVLSVSIAEKVVRKELSTDAGQQELVDRIFDELS
ncbi:MAG: F0F1 ATP synthase subunit B [Bacteroidales bacterium]|nr:F0F1 ATP synthase subunit B [Bacteroidales bacterium]MBQ8855091.1 F0F1 ATP synthase subunit B [Bacteroidales bacterium]